MAIPGWLAGDPRVVAVRHRDQLPGHRVDWPDWLPEPIRASVVAAGIEAPWGHQATAAQAAWSGRHVALSTPTASGKSLAYLLPIMAATAVPRDQASLGVQTTDLRSRLGVARHSALYLAPTKALAHDQRAAARRLGPRGWQVANLDGDSESAERQFARDYAGLIFSNPDMLHRSVLPNHANWSGLLGSLRYVVVDEAHRYRGVFGSQVSAVLRRLRRLCAAYGSEPVFVLASATANEAGASGALLIGEDQPLFEVATDDSPHAARDVVLWKPSGDAPHEAAELLARLVDDGQQVITFVANNRTEAELIALRAAERIESGRQVASYRSGYLAADQRRLEGLLRSGELAGVASTNALELGVDISGLDSVVITGFLERSRARSGSGLDAPGAASAMPGWCPVARDDPLDAHLFDHPELIFDRPVERTVLYPGNPYVARPASGCGGAGIRAHRRGRTVDRADHADLGRPADRAEVAAGSAQQFSTGRVERAVDSIDLRGTIGRPVEIIETESGRVISSVDRGAADRTVHEGAVYLQASNGW